MALISNKSNLIACISAQEDKWSFSKTREISGQTIFQLKVKETRFAQYIKHILGMGHFYNY